MPDALDERARRRQEAKRLHRRDTRWRIMLPLALAFLLIFTLFGLVAFPAESVWRLRASAISDFLVSLLVLCPLILCLFPVYLLTVLLAWWATRLHRGVQPPLERLQTSLDQAGSQLQRTAEMLSHKTIDWSAKLAPLLSLLSFFDRPNHTPQEQPPHEPK
jgi:predicted PurR-regulated permease PerM